MGKSPISFRREGEGEGEGEREREGKERKGHLLYAVSSATIEHSVNIMFLRYFVHFSAYFLP